jgi:hypothetical protein
MDFAVPNAVSRSMVLCMGVASGAISAGAAVNQTTVTAGTIMEATKMPLTKWFQAFYLVGDAKNRYFFTLPEAKVGCQLPHCMVGAQQDYASDE